MREFKWDQSKSKSNILKTVVSIEKLENEGKANDMEQVKTYKKNLTKMFNEGETETNILLYKNSVLNMLKLKSV